MNMRLRSAPLLALPLLLAAAPGARADRKAEALVKQARQAMARVKTLQAKMVLDTETPAGQRRLEADLLLMRPNLAQIRLRSSPAGALDITLRSDGRQVFMVNEAAKEYETTPADPKLANLFGNADGQPLIAAFFAPATIAAAGRLGSAGSERIDGKTYQVVPVTASKAPRERKYYFRSDGILERVTLKHTEADDTRTVTAWLTALRLNPPLKAEQFVYRPPADYAAVGKAAEGLLPVGRPAPDFDLPRPQGGRLRLADARQGKKVVLVNFWSTSCDVCREEFPLLAMLYETLKAKGLEIVAVNLGDSEEAVNKYLADNPLPFPVVLGGVGDHATVAQSYQIQVFPTSYLLAADGKVLWSSRGFDETALRKALAEQGLR
jgi:thiol-disulfide isomerase/thioredoxin